MVKDTAGVLPPRLPYTSEKGNARGAEYQTLPYLSISTILRLNLHFGSCAPPFMKSITGDALLRKARNTSSFHIEGR